MDTLDPTNTYHKYSNQKQCDTLRVNFAGDHNYQHITYLYYEDMERNNHFDLDEYVTRLTKYYQHNEQAFNKPRHERVIDVPHPVYTLFREQDPSFLQEIFDFRQRAENRVRELKEKVTGTGPTKHENRKMILTLENLISTNRNTSSVIRTRRGQI
jgi:hypothetical protein